jgi:hypothetical protein
MFTLLKINKKTQHPFPQDNDRYKAKGESRAPTIVLGHREWPYGTHPGQATNLPRDMPENQQAALTTTRPVNIARLSRWRKVMDNPARFDVSFHQAFHQAGKVSLVMIRRSPTGVCRPGTDAVWIHLRGCRGRLRLPLPRTAGLWRFAIPGAMSPWSRRMKRSRS